MERELLDWWRVDGIVEKYLQPKRSAQTRYSFLDGPITANNPMGVHHAWGRTYKDLFQRYQNMLGKSSASRTVSIARVSGSRSKSRKSSVSRASATSRPTAWPNSSRRCKDRVIKFGARQTEQSIRLGYCMDWDNRYYTMSDENNYTIWHFLKTCHERGWILQGARRHALVSALRHRYL